MMRTFLQCQLVSVNDENIPEDRPLLISRGVQVSVENTSVEVQASSEARPLVSSGVQAGASQLDPEHWLVLGMRLAYMPVVAKEIW